MTRRRQDAGERDRDGLERIERKVDRLARLVVALLICQPVLFVGLIMPDTATQFLAFALLGLLGVLLAFPNLERTLPARMRQAGRVCGRLRRRVRVLVSR